MLVPKPAPLPGLLLAAAIAIGEGLPNPFAQPLVGWQALRLLPSIPSPWPCRFSACPILAGIALIEFPIPGFTINCRRMTRRRTTRPSRGVR